MRFLNLYLCLTNLIRIACNGNTLSAEERANLIDQAGEDRSPVILQIRTTKAQAI